MYAHLRCLAFFLACRDHDIDTLLPAVWLHSPADRQHECRAGQGSGPALAPHIYHRDVVGNQSVGLKEYNVHNGKGVD